MEKDLIFPALGDGNLMRPLILPSLDQEGFDIPRLRGRKHYVMYVTLFVSWKDLIFPALGDGNGGAWVFHAFAVAKDLIFPALGDGNPAQ